MVDTVKFQECPPEWTSYKIVADGEIVGWVIDRHKKKRFDLESSDHRLAALEHTSYQTMDAAIEAVEKELSLTQV